MSSKSHSQSNSSLGRGQACIHCRRRKMRCDGARPVCGQCARTSAPEDCEYTDKQGRSRAEILEENIARVEARIYELEHPEMASGEPILLHHPYLQPGPAPDAEESEEWLPEPPAEMIPVLIDRFLGLASEVGFFLNPTRFRASVVRDRPYGHPSRPIPALLTTAYLWGIHFFGNASAMTKQELYLKRAVSQVATSLSSTHPDKVIQTIQAEYLIAYYFFSSGRFLEGKYHVSAAMSIIVAGGFLKIRSSDPVQSNVVMWTPTSDMVAEGEQIDACWTGVVLDKGWAVALGSEPNVTCPQTVINGQLDTPWPLEQNQYEEGGYPRYLRTHSTVRRFLSGDMTSGGDDTSLLALFSKAVILWHRSNALVGNWKRNMTPEESDTFFGRFAVLAGLSEKLKDQLTPPDQLTDRTPAKMRMLFLTHSLTYAAIIQLHGPLTSTNLQSKQKVLNAALTIFRQVSAIRLGAKTQFINPLLGTVWIMASRVLFEDVTIMKSRRDPRSEPSDIEKDLRLVIENGLRDMQPLARSCVLMRYQLHQINEAYSSA